MDADHDVALSLQDRLYGTYTCAAGQNTVVSRRTAAALHIAEDRHAHVELGELLAHTVGIIHRTALRTLRDDDDTALLRLADTTLHELGELVDIGGVFRDDGSLSTAGDGRVLREITGITAHHFHEEDALVALCGIANAVHTFYYGIKRRVVTNRCICAIEVVVYGSGKTDTTHGHRSMNRYHR